MRNILLLSGALLLVFAIPVQADTSETVQEILGRTLETAHVKQAHIYADGTLDGIYNGISYAGVWALEDGKYCRELTRGLVSKRACLDLQAVRDEAGILVAVEFQSPSVTTRFTLR